MVIVDTDNVPATWARIDTQEAGRRDSDVRGTSDDGRLELYLSIRDMDEAHADAEEEEDHR